MESNEEIAFQIYFEDTVTPIIFESGKTITEFKEFIGLCLECEPKDLALYLEQYGKIKRETVDMLFDISSARSKIILSEMIKENMILKKGTGKNTYYVLK